MEKIIRTRLIELLFDTEDKEQHDIWRDQIRHYAMLTRLASNDVVNQLFLNDIMVKNITTIKSLTIPNAMKDLSDFLQTSLRNTGYRIITKKYPDLPSNIKSSISNTIASTYNKERKEVVKGERSIRTYRNNMPIPCTVPGFRWFQDGEKIGFKWVGGINMKCRFGKDLSNNREIVKRVIRGEYKMSDSSIKIKGKKKFLLLCYQIPDKQTSLNPELIVGVDLGINVPAYVAINKGWARKAIGSRNGFLMPRLRIQAQRRTMQKQLNFISGGKGRNKKLKRLDYLRNKEKDTVKLLNHCISKEVVNFALKWGAGTIHLENLSGIGSDEKNKWILRNWSYFQLQNFITYKANEYGIEVKKINPRYTSQTCPWCGERGERPEQKYFNCSNEDCAKFNKQLWADHVGALNIARATPPVEKRRHSTKGVAPGAVSRPEAEG